MKNQFALIFSIFILSTFIACNEDCEDPCNVDCNNYDPCCGQTKSDASFTIYELLGNGPKPSDGFESKDVATDTILNSNFALFRADFEADYYEWSVGTDPRVWNTREFSLRFGLPNYTPIPITLKVYKESDKTCFPNNSDTAVFTRLLITVPKDSSRVLGRFEGYMESAPEEKNFFEIDTTTDFWGDRKYSIAGITPKCSTSSLGGGGLEDIQLGYRSFYLSSIGTKIGCCNGLSAFGVVDNNKNLLMDFGIFPFNPNDTCQWSVLNDPYVNDIFSGIKQ
ncbi:hypothetical protein HZR84_03410 [Hyphobacterium sp. CCMP332]|nr:hypothetical protein HZR84_03410 [Hyphobacterium sp. CCMP332]